jgi:neprosin-like protein
VAGAGKQARRLRLFAGIATLALASAGCLGCSAEPSTAPPVAPRGAPAPKGTPPTVVRSPGPISTSLRSGNAKFFYVSFTEFATDGASAVIDQAQPIVGPNDYHSLVEMAATSSDLKQIVEIGWTVDRRLNGDARPHLFVYHWVNGAGTCYNACGFVPVSRTVVPGERVQVGKTGTYAIQHSKGKWWTLYNGERVGYFPESLWTRAGASFTRSTYMQVFGEVSAGSSKPCTQMGDGTFGSAPHGSRIDDVKLAGPTSPMEYNPYEPTPKFYDAGTPAKNVYSFGGPGAAC